MIDLPVMLVSSTWKFWYPLTFSVSPYPTTGCEELYPDD